METVFVNIDNPVSVILKTVNFRKNHRSRFNDLFKVSERSEENLYFYLVWNKVNFKLHKPISKSLV